MSVAAGYHSANPDKFIPKFSYSSSTVNFCFEFPTRVFKHIIIKTFHSLVSMAIRLLFIEAFKCFISSQRLTTRACFFLRGKLCFRILVPHQGLNSCTLQWKCRILTSGSPGNSQEHVFICCYM